MAESGNQQKTTLDNWDRAMKAMSIVLGILLVVLGVINFVSFKISDPIDIVLPVYYM